MTYTTSPILELKLAVVGSGQAWETVEFNTNMLKIDTAIGDIQDQLADFSAIVNVADLATLDAVDGPRGNLATVQQAGITGLQHDLLMRCGIGPGFVWYVECAMVGFDTKANLDTFVGAQSARFLRGQKFWVNADSGREYTWDGSALRPTSLLVSATQPANPVTDQVWGDKS